MMVRGSKVSLFTVFTMALLLLCVSRLAWAQGAWPPTANPGDDPYNAGTFQSGSQTYRIDFDRVIANPNPDPNYTAPAIGTYIGVDIQGSPISGSFTFDSSNTNAGSTHGLWRFAQVGANLHGHGEYNSIASPVFRYKITAITTPNANWGVQIRVAQGSNSYYASANNDSSPGATVYGTGIGVLGTVHATSPMGYMSLSGRGADIFESVTLANGVAYFCVNAPISCDIKLDTTIKKKPDPEDWASGWGRWEMVPLQVLGP